MLIQLNSKGETPNMPKIHSMFANLPIIHADQTQTNQHDAVPAEGGQWLKELNDIIERGSTSLVSSMLDWSSFAGQMQNENGSSQVQRRLQFIANNLSNLFHSQFFGNRQPFRTTPTGRLDVDGNGNRLYQPPTETEMRSQSVRFAAKQNLDYWEGLEAQYLTEAQANGQIFEQYADDFTYQNILVRKREALLWHNVLLSMGFWVEVLEFLTGEQYIFQPYEERKIGASPIQNTRALAATLMSRK